MSSSKSTDNKPFLRDCLATQRKKVVSIVVFSIVINLMMLTIPLYLLQIFNRVIPSQSTDTLIALTVIVFVCLSVMALLEVMRRLILSHIGTWFASRLGGFVLSGTIAESASRARPASSQGLTELSTVRRLFSGSSIFPMLDLPWTPVFLLVLFLLHPLIGTITLVGALCLLCIAIYSEISTRNLSSLADDASKTSKKYTTSILRNSDVIEAMGMRDNVIANWDKHYDRKVELQSRLSARTNRIAAFARFFRLILQIAVIGTAGYLVLQHEMTAGGLIASLLLMRRAVAPVEQAINSWKVAQRIRKAFKNIGKRVDHAPELVACLRYPVPSGNLRISNISYTYPNRSKPTLRNLSFSAHPGEIVGITGKTAVGKTTLARLLVGLVEPDSGSIKFGGTRIGSWKTEDIGPVVGYLPQDNDLFAGTVGENIARMGSVDKEAMIEAAELADVHEMISQFPEGYEVGIGEEGAYFSGGQRQRIALARAIYKSPRLLVLDEPDANLDREGMTALFNIIESMRRQGSIVIFISHREKVLEIADKTLRIDRGTIKLESEARKDRLSTESGMADEAKVINIEATKV